MSKAYLIKLYFTILDTYIGMHSVLVDTQSEAQSALEPELPPGTGVVTVPKLSLAGHMDPPVVHHGGAPQLAAIVPVRGAGGVGRALEDEGDGSE